MTSFKYSFVYLAYFLIMVFAREARSVGSNKERL